MVRICYSEAEIFSCVVSATRSGECHHVTGAVAQLGERHVRNVEVVGSIPICSIFNIRREKG